MQKRQAVDFSEPFDASAFITPIPNSFTKVRGGVLWTHGRDPEAKYPPMVYYPIDGGSDIDIQFRFRILGEGRDRWLHCFVDADDGGGGMDHCVRVLLRAHELRFHVDGKTTDPNHPGRQPNKPADKVSGLYRVPESFDPVPLEIGVGVWRTLRLSFRGDALTTSIPELNWSHTFQRPTFPHPKRKLLWMQNGGEEGIEIDDLVINAASAR